MLFDCVLLALVGLQRLAAERFVPLLVTMLMNTPPVPTEMSCAPVDTWMFSKALGM